MKRLRYLSIVIAVLTFVVELPHGALNVLAQSQDPSTLVSTFDVNGLKVIVKRRMETQTVAAGLFLQGGCRNITADTAGIEALMLDVEGEASANFPRERLRRELARTASRIGFSTGRDYSILSLGSTSRHFDRAWEIFGDVIVRPAFTREDFDRVKNRQIVSRSDDEDTPDSFIQILQARAAYRGHPYENDPDGTVASLTRITLDDVKRHHREMMQTSRLLLVVVGNVDVARLREKVQDVFRAVPRGSYQPSAVAALAYNAPAVTITPRELALQYVQGIYAAPPITSPDFYPMQVASSILQDRVFESVRVRRNLSYAPDSFLRVQGAAVGGIYVSTADPNQAVQVMLGEIARLQDETVDARQLRHTTQGFLTSYYLDQQTNGAQAANLAEYELLGAGWTAESAFLERIRAVTPADVRRVAARYMRSIQFVVLGNPKTIDPKIFIEIRGASPPRTPYALTRGAP